MKMNIKKNYVIAQLILVCAALVLVQFAGPALAQENSGGHLLIARVANFGSDLFLVVSVDGKQVGRVGDGSSYDGWLTPGQHTVSAAVSPNRDDVKPTQVTVTAKAGETYSYTAVWQGSSSLGLTKN